MLAKEAVRHIVALMQGEDEIVIMLDGVVYDISVIARAHIAGSEDVGVIITVTADDEEEGDDDEYTEDGDEEGDDDEYEDDDEDDDENEDGVSVDLAERFLALGELDMAYALAQLADFELRRRIRQRLSDWRDARDELQSRIEARKRDRGVDPSLKYETGIYGKGQS